MSADLIIFLCALIFGASLGWIAWNVASKRWTLPCPSQFAWMVEMQNPLARHTRSENIIKFLCLKGSERVLEIGCGPGRVSIPLAKAIGEGGTLVSLDLQQEMLDRVESKRAAENLTQLQLVASDIRDYEVEIGTYDKVLLVMSLGEIPEANSELRQIRPWLVKNGELVVCESVFDPHFIRQKRLRWMMLESGYELKRLEGNLFGYLAAFSSKDQDLLA